MQKNKRTTLIASAVGLLSIVLVTSSVSAAQPEKIGKPEKTLVVQENRTVKTNGNRANAESAQAGIVNEATPTAVAADTADKNKKNTLKENKGKTTAESHRSAVANAVQNLLTVADRESGIGQQVKVIAEQQNDAKDRAADIIYAVENRSKIKTFFIGTSYRNLGELRSQMVQTRNQIDQLRRLADKADNDQDKADLQTQIQALEQEQTKIDAFITSNENQFSLFGWAMKLFR